MPPASGLPPGIGSVAALPALHRCCRYQPRTWILALYHSPGGTLFHHAQARPAALAYALITLIALCASVPAWQAMGLL